MIYIRLMRTGEKTGVLMTKSAKVEKCNVGNFYIPVSLYNEGGRGVSTIKYVD